MPVKIEDPEYREILHLLLAEVEWKKYFLAKMEALPKIFDTHTRDFEKQVDLIYNKYHGRENV